MLEGVRINIVTGVYKQTNKQQKIEQVKFLCFLFIFLKVLKHLAKEVKVPPSSLVEEAMDPISEHKRHSLTRRENPPPEYPGGKFVDSSPSTILMQRCKNGKKDKNQLSKSQPDLSKVGVGRPKTKGREEFSEGGKRWAEMVNSLAQENSRLKSEIESYMQKVAKTQKVG